MAIDTEPKRWSMLRVANGPIPGFVFNPTGSDADTATERVTILGVYGGITFVETLELVVSAIVGGASLSTLAYCVFDDYDVGTATVVKQGNDETTDTDGDLVIDVSGLGFNVGDPATIIITNYTTSPDTTSRAAVCYTTVTSAS